MNRFNRSIVIVLSGMFFGMLAIFLSGCAVSGCGNPNTTSTMSDSNNNLGSFNEQEQTNNISQQAPKPIRKVKVRHSKYNNRYYHID